MKATWTGIDCAQVQAESAIRLPEVNKERCVSFYRDGEKRDISWEDLNNIYG